MQMKKIAAALAVVCLTATTAQAGEREDMELVRQTTNNLIEALVDSGVLTRAAADELIKKAQKKAADSVAAMRAEDRKTVRVTYVPESVRAEIREQVKQEVLSQAKSERWGDPGALPEWMDRIQWEGDVRVRYQTDRYAKDNSGLAAYDSDFNSGSPAATRFPDAVGTSATQRPAFNLIDNRSRWRVRARLGVLAKLTPMVSAGVRLTTGNTTDRVSTNQTLGQNFNKYTATFDRAYVRLDPAEWLSVSAGRIPNPWFSTDLVWDEDLNFEGMAVSLKGGNAPGATFSPFLTVGAFPLREDSPPTAKDRWLYGIQAGAKWDLTPSTRSKFGVALYDFRDINGRVQTDEAYNLGQSDFNYARYEYPSSLRQKGNTLFRTNAPFDNTSAPLWGLASKFRVLNMTASVDMANWEPVHLILTGDYARNLAFDKNDILKRTGLNVTDSKARNAGWQVKATLGMPRIRERNDWQVSFAYRYLGSDAVLDAFTDSDYNLGGTNHKGYVLSAAYGIDRNTSLGLRWMSFDSISTTTFSTANGRFGTDTLQVDLTASF